MKWFVSTFDSMFIHAESSRVQLEPEPTVDTGHPWYFSTYWQISTDGATVDLLANKDSFQIGLVDMISANGRVVDTQCTKSSASLWSLHCCSFIATHAICYVLHWHQATCVRMHYTWAIFQHRVKIIQKLIPKETIMGKNYNNMDNKARVTLK